MKRPLCLLVPLALLAACAGEGSDEAVVASLQDMAVAPQNAGPSPPGPVPQCIVATPIGAPAPGPGDLDKYFGCGGYASVSAVDGDVEIRGIAVQPDDKIVATGEIFDHPSNHNTVWVARFTSAGKLDPLFGTAGVFTTSFTTLGGADNGETVAIAPNGTILVGGGRRNENVGDAAPAGFLLRLLPNGTLDPTFGAGGAVLTTALTYVKKLRLTASGNIVVAGESCNYTPPAVCNAAVGRFSGVNGAADPAFGVNGVIVTGFGGGAPASALGAAVNGNDVVVVGTATVSTHVDVGLARYGATALVSSFGASGNALYNLTASPESGRAIANVGQDFVAIDNYSSSGTPIALVLHLLPNGALSPAFGFGGVNVVTLSTAGSTANDVIPSATGQLLFAGTGLTSTSHSRMAVARLSGVNGAPDATFSADGAVQLSGGVDDAAGNTLGLQSTGRVIVGGWSRATGGNKRALLARVLN